MTEDNEVKQRQLNELGQRREVIAEMGGKERVKAQQKKGKLTARERVDLLKNRSVK
jgi:acetyl-CoA carboxylase carboxyltransferase component